MATIASSRGRERAGKGRSAGDSEEWPGRGRFDGKDGRVRGKRRREVRAEIDGGELASPNLEER